MSSSPWELVGSIVKLVDESNNVRVGPPGPALSIGTPRLLVTGRLVASEPSSIPLQDKGGNVFDVRAYGALGDGISDDVPRVRDAVAALRAAGGGTLYFPPGRYHLSDEIVIDGMSTGPDKLLPFLVCGAGPGATTLVTTSVTANTLRTRYDGALQLGREIFMEIRDLSFEVAKGVTKTAGDAIRQECSVQFQNTFIVRNCWFRDVFNGIHLTAVGSAIISGCQLLNPKNAAVFLEQTTSSPSADFGLVLISNNFFFRKPSPSTGVYGLHVTTGATGVRVEHNAFLQFDHPLLFELADQSLHTAIDIDSNLFDGGSLFPKIHFTGPGNVHRITIANNHIVVIGDHGPNQTGIQVEISQGTLPNRTFHHAVITGNVLDGSPGESFGRGIVLNPTAVGGCHDVLVSGNAFSNLATGIEIGPNCRRIFLSENAFEAATVTTPIVNNDLEPRGAFFPDRLGVGRVNAVTEAGLSKAKEIYAFSSQAGRPRVYLQGAPGVSTPGVEFAFDSTNTRRAAIVGRDVGAGVQLELFTKPNGSGGATQRIVLDPDGNLVWTSSGYAEMMEAGAEPPAPAADRARLFLRDQGGKTQLCVRFATGAVQVLATQP